MRKKLLILLAIIIFCCGISFVYFHKEQKQYVSPIANPEKIIAYNKGKVTTISESDEKYKKLVDAANNRIKSITGEPLTAFKKDELKKESILLEFDYPSENKLSYYEPRSKKEESITYTKLYFCLDKNLSASKVMDFEGKGYGPWPLGFLSSPDEMLKVLNE